MLFGLLFNLLRVCSAPFVLLRRAVLRRRPVWVALRLDGGLTELAPAERRLQRWLNWARPRPVTLTDLREVTRAIASDHGVRGVLLEIPHTLRAGWSTLVGLRGVVAELRAAGKHVVAYLPDGGGTREIYAALAADTIWIAPGATLAFLGIASESMYLKALLDRLGVSVEVHAAGRFKTAAEPLLAERMSDAQREQRQPLLDAVHEEFIEALRHSGRMSADSIAEAFSSGLLRGESAVTCGLVDAVCYADQVAARLPSSGEAATGKPAARPRVMSLTQYRWAFAESIWRPVLPLPYVAVIAVHGTIGLDASPAGGNANVAALTSALNAVRRDPRAVAAVLHIDSPGGSALASDHIHRDVARLAEQKPVVACFGEVAASGGYYVAAPAQRIVAQPTTVTGSIGVISAKVVLDRLLQNVGVQPQGLKTAVHADMFSAARPLRDDEHAIMEREAQGVYRTFLEVVATGRKRPVDEIEALAAGRVWSGRDALRHGLVDRLGGLDVALDEARALVSGLSVAARGRLRPRVVQRFASRRALPTTTEPEAMLLAWLGRVAPDLARLWSAQCRGERLLLLAPWLSDR